MGCSHSGSSLSVAENEINTSAVPGSAPSSSNESKSKNVSEAPHTLNDRYTLGEVLGEGGYSVVKLGISKDQFQRKVAVKIVTRSNISKDDEQSLRSEVAIGLELKHPNIVRVLDFFRRTKILLHCS